ncbi:serine peptidase, partial [Bacillus sp. SIMBA_074]
MKKQVLSLGLALVLLPITTVNTGRVNALAGIDTTSFQTQIIQDMQDAAFPVQVKKQTTKEGSESRFSVADEWQRAEHSFLGEQVSIPQTSSLDMIEATKAWQDAGVKGEGMLVSVVDTGVNPKHPDMPAPRDKRLAQQKSGSTKKVIPGY